MHPNITTRMIIITNVVWFEVSAMRLICPSTIQNVTGTNINQNIVKRIIARFWLTYQKSIKKSEIQYEKEVPTNKDVNQMNKSFRFLSQSIA